MRKKGLVDAAKILQPEDVIADDDPVSIPTYGEQMAQTAKRAVEGDGGEAEKKPRAKKQAKRVANTEVVDDDEPRPKSPTKNPSSATRLNVTEEQREKLSELVLEMQRVGPERFLKASEIVGALIDCLYDAREELDLSNVHRRGKFGSSKHRLYRTALVEAMKVTISNHHQRES